MKKRYILCICIVVVLIVTTVLVFFLKKDTVPVNKYSGSFCTGEWYGEDVVLKPINNVLYVYDIKTQTSSPLCCAPNCKHDTESCVAIPPQHGVGWIGAFIYNDQLVELFATGNYTEVYMANKDGSERKRVAYTDEYMIFSSVSYVMNNDHLYFIAVNDEFVEETNEVSSKYYLSEYDISNQKFSIIYKFDNNKLKYIRSINIVDDTFYFHMNYNEKNGFFSLNDDELSFIDINKEYTEPISICGDKAYYHSFGDKNYDEPKYIIEYDLIKNKSREISECSEYIVSEIINVNDNLLYTADNTVDGVFDPENIKSIQCVNKDNKIIKCITNTKDYNYSLITSVGDTVFLLRAVNEGWSDKQNICYINIDDLLNGDASKIKVIENCDEIIKTQSQDIVSDSEYETDNSDNDENSIGDNDNNTKTPELKSTDTLCSFDVEPEKIDESLFSGKTKLVWALTDVGNDKAHIQNEVNKYLDEKGYDFAVEFIQHPEIIFDDSGNDLIDPMLSFYKESVKNGEQIDLISTGGAYDIEGLQKIDGTYCMFTDQDLLIPLNEYFNTDLGKKMYNTYPEWYWKTLSDENGNIYGRGFSYLGASTLGIALNKEIIDLYGMDLSDYNNTLEGLDEWVEKTYEMIKRPLILIEDSEESYEGLVGYIKNTGIYFNTETNSFDNIYENPKTIEHLKLLENYIQKGYMTNKSTEDSIETSAAIIQQIIPSYKYAEDAILLEMPYTKRDSINFAQGITNSCKNPDKAFELLALCTVDKALIDILYNGTEGRNYLVNDDGVVVRNLKSNAFSDWQESPANYLLASINALENVKKLETYSNISEKTKVDPLKGFKPYTNNIKKELDKCAEIYQKGYRLFYASYGEYDTLDSALEDINKQLHDAGIDDVVTELNKQYQQYLEDKK